MGGIRPARMTLGPHERWDAVFRIENAIDLGAARFQQDRHARLGNLFLLHRLRQLPGYDLLDGLRLRFLEDVFFLQEVVNTRSHIFLTHLLLFFLAANSGGSSSPSTGGFPFPTRFRMRAILAGSARRARAVKYSSVRKAEIFSATATLIS